MAFLPIDQPLDLAASLESGQAFRWRRRGAWFEGVLEDNVVKLRRVRGGLEFYSYPDAEADVAPRLRDYLRLQDDLPAIYRALEWDPRVREAIARYPGLRILRQDPWECTAAFICSMWSNIRRIEGHVEELARRLGRPLGARSRRRAFPDPATVADAGEGYLRRLGLGFRAKYLAATARRIAEGQLDLAALRSRPYDEALKSLLALPGMGDKVANCVLLFSLDKLEAFPVDVWIGRALQEWYLDGRRMTPLRMRRWAQERFGPYAGYAQQYLFHRRRLAGTGGRPRRPRHVK